MTPASRCDGTGRDGRYAVEYGAERFAAAEAGRPDLQVAVVQADEELARSEVRFNAAGRETVDVTLTDARPGVRGICVSIRRPLRWGAR